MEGHLADCAGCQVFVSGLKPSLELLREAHQEPMAPAHFAAVRARVLAKLSRKRLPLWRRAWVYGLAAAAVVVLVLMAGRTGRTPQPKRPPEVAVVTPAPVQPEAKVEEPPLPKPLHQARHRRRIVQEPAVQPPPPVLVAQAEPVLVKLVTDDPNVVIYWIAERRGDSK